MSVIRRLATSLHRRAAMGRHDGLVQLAANLFGEAEIQKNNLNKTIMNVHFKQTTLFLVIALFLEIFISCTGPVTISGVPLRLLANFNADAAGTRPNAALPGDPAGDEILYRGSGGVYNPVVEGENKRLRIVNRSSGSDHDSRMVFRGTAITYPTTVYYSWKLNIENPFVNGTFIMNLTDGTGNDNVRLEFMDYQWEPQGVPLFGYLYLMPTREFLGKVPVGQNCSYHVTINPVTNTFYLAISRPGFSDGDLTIRDHPLSVPISNGTKNPSIEIRSNTDPPETQADTGWQVNRPDGWLFLDDLMIQAN